MMPQQNVELEIDPDPQLEREAESTAQRVMDGGELGIQRLGDSDVHVQRLSQEGKERLERLRDRLDLTNPTEDEVREAVEAIPVDLAELSDPEEIKQLFRTGSNQQVSNAESLVVAEAVFEHIKRVEAETDPRFAGSLLPVAGSNREDARLSLADGIDVDTVHHELGHAVADAHGYNVGDRATYTNKNRYDPSRNNFPEVPESEYPEHHLTQVDPGDVPQELERLIAEVNNAWERMQSAHTDNSDNEHMYTFEAFSDIDNYSAVHAHETLAHLHEAMQFDELRHPANWFYRHGDLLRAYVQVFDPCPTKRSLISHLHREDPEVSPFSSDPYPGSDPDQRAIEAWKKDVKTTLEKDDKFANAGQYYEVEHYE